MENEKLLKCVAALSYLTDRLEMAELEIITQASRIMADLVAVDDWLPDAMAQPHPQFYQQHLLYGDPRDRFSLVSFVWGPGQKTPIHDHTVWGVIAMLRGAELEQPYGIVNGHLQPTGEERALRPGETSYVSPVLGDIHRVSNMHDDKVSISIHLYGGNIGRISRCVYDIATGERKPFVSGYSNRYAPNLWVSVPDSTQTAPVLVLP